MFLERETQLESQIQPSGISLFSQDPALPVMRSSGLGRAGTAGAPIVTQVGFLLQVPKFLVDLKCLF